MKLLSLSLLVTTSITLILQCRENNPPELTELQRENTTILMRGNYRPTKFKKNKKLILEKTVNNKKFRVSMSPSGKVTKKTESSYLTKFIVALGMLYAAKKISDIIGLTSAYEKCISVKKS